MELSNEILSNITVYMKYAKYIPELNRRESWDELVNLIEKNPDTQIELKVIRNENIIITNLSSN